MAIMVTTAITVAMVMMVRLEKMVIHRQMTTVMIKTVMTTV